MNKIEIIYKMIINGISLNDTNLQIYGFTKSEIEELIIKKVIIIAENSTYKLYQVDKLRKYGVKLLQDGKIKEAKMCFRICYELLPTGKNICLQAMLLALENKEYEKVFEIYANLEEIYPEKNEADNRLYLYLLSMILIIPDEYKERSRKIEPSTLILPDTNGTKVENEIRKAISENKFAYACTLIKDRKAKETNYSLKFELLEFLCNKAVERRNRFKTKIFKLIQKGKYEKVRSMLLEDQSQRRLSEQETNILLLVDVIIKMQETGIIPKETTYSTSNLQEAILGNNFGVALQINDKFIEEHGINKEKDLISILLTRINELIGAIKEKDDTQEEPVCPASSGIESSIEPTAPKTTSSILTPELISGIEELAEFVLKSKSPIDKTIKNYGILPKDALLVILVIARKYFEDGDYENGDKYLKEVENSNLKTPVVEELLKEIKANRLCYQKGKKPYARRLIAVLNIRKEQI